MNKSQLRRLARDYASGRVEHDEYLRMRGTLIDAIVTGEVSIESPAGSVAEPALAPPPERRIRATPVALVAGTLAVIVFVWMVLSSQRTNAPSPGSHGDADQVPELRVTAARTLVNDFLATRDWSTESLAMFRELWNALTPNEQADARAAPWFRRLAEALREEINAHTALTESDGKGLSTTTGKRLAAFGEFLGIDAEITHLQSPDPAAPDRPDALPAREQKPLSGSQWLEAQPGGNYTLQLSAVDHLDRLEPLIASHPEVPLYLLAWPGQQPRFRLLHGSFASEEQARLAYGTLPAALRGQAQGPFVRRIDYLREELRGDHRGMSPVTADPVTQPLPVYTLQVFASSSRENVDRLVARYQGLHLRVHISGGDSTPFRVLYGTFDSPQAAQEAAAKIPATMLEEVGKPLLRDISEFN
jgi:septal ring-binding cell division protein DamX